MTAEWSGRRHTRRFLWWVFGDRPGLLLWLGVLCWFGLTWRVGIFIQDTYAVANALVALADGHLHVTELRYSITFGSQPGLSQHGGRLYGRNYGQLALAVPLVWALEGFSSIVAPRLLLAALWAALGLAFVAQASQLDGVDRERARTVGSVVVAVLFVGSVLTATDLPRDRLALAALQLSTMTAAATACLICYRLLRIFHGRRVGLTAGIALGVATPVGFWATIPKRHTVVALLTLATVYAFAVSRRADGRAALRARAGAYALAGLVTWVHAFEAFFLVGTLCVVDLLTARSNRPRDLLVVGCVLLLAATPMLATNYAISGNPAKPPRLLPGAEDGDVEFVPSSGAGGGAGGGANGGDGSTGEGGGADGGSGTIDGGADVPILDTVGEAARPAWRFVGGAAVKGIGVLGDPARLVDIFVRSGHIDGVRYDLNDHEVIELSLLEATPILGALLTLPVLVGRRVREDGQKFLRGIHHRYLSARRQTDLLVVVLTVVLTVVYLPRLPLYSMLTVRYLHPIVPLALYGVCRVPAVRMAVTEATGSLARFYAAGITFALAVVFGGIVSFDLALGEAVQYHALWNLGAAAVCAGTVFGRTVAPDRVSPRAVAAGLALSAAFATAYLLLSGVVYFEYGTDAFDLVRVVTAPLPSL